MRSEVGLNHPTLLTPPVLLSHAFLFFNTLCFMLSRYCLRRPKGRSDAPPMCRFGYPKDPVEETHLEFEEIKDGRVHVKLVT